MPINKAVIVNDPFREDIKWKKNKNSPSRDHQSRTRRRRTRSRSRSCKRRRSRSRSRSKPRHRHRSRSRSRPDARTVIRSRYDDDKARGEKRISNMNKIKGLERKLQHTEQENTDLKRRLKERDFQYGEMKKRAMTYKQRLAMGSNMNVPFFQPNFMPYSNFQQPSMPRSVSNETIICPTFSSAS